ncbi:MAG: hypothetical protein K9M45_00120 [Kiritimatiellales bacterium]|nr:hypothetical protein [Kiritimatiellales bacterium]
MKRFFVFFLVVVVACAVSGGEELSVTVDCRKQFQTIENIGSSTGMHGAYIGRRFPRGKLDQLAELFFSTEIDSNRKLKGIGLSSFRIQIGAGTDEQENCGIVQPFRRTECFLRPDGSYDWSRCAGAVYWIKKAKEYQLPCLIGYANSPPVYWTENGLGYKTGKAHRSNLKPEHYGDYAGFLATIAARFGFDYISPVNEPQWDWAFERGKAKQEGSPWTNAEIATLVREVDTEFRQRKLETKILIPEAASLSALFQGKSESANQIDAFWNKRSDNYVGDLRSVAQAVAGHSYFADGDPRKYVRIRQKLAEAVKDAELRFWQTEYSLLEEGYLHGLDGKPAELDCALVLAKQLHLDLSVAQAAAWQFWTSTGGKHVSRVPRFHLVRIDFNEEETDGEITVTKMLWALGHYSRFVRPGMVRVDVQRSDKATDEESAEGLMVSAYADLKTSRVVMVIVNRAKESYTLDPKVSLGGRTLSRTEGFITDETRNMEWFTLSKGTVAVPARSIITLVAGR